MSRSKYHIVISRDENDSFKPGFVSRILSQADVDEGQLLQNRVKKRESSYANEIFRCEDGETKQWLCLN